MPREPGPAAARTFLNGSRRSSPRSSAHRADRRRRAAVRVHRSRRSAPPGVPRASRNPSRSAARADARHHRGRISAGDPVGGRGGSSIPRRPRRGNLIAEPVLARDWLRIAELVAKYRDLPLGTADASVVAAAERLGITEVATLDRRHFTVVRPSTGPFTVLP